MHTHSVCVRLHRLKLDTAQNCTNKNLVPLLGVQDNPEKTKIKIAENSAKGILSFTKILLLLRTSLKSVKQKNTLTAESKGS